MANPTAYNRVEYQLGNFWSVNWTRRYPSSTTNPLVIDRLLNGQTYQVRIRAIGPAGSGPISDVISFSPATTPSPPHNFTVVPGDSRASVSFTNGSDGGRPITNYEYSIDNGSTWITRNPASNVLPLVINGLVNGRTYSLKVRAVNELGSRRGIPVEQVIIAAVAPGTPSQPTILSGSAVDGLATLTFIPPANSGNSADTRYECSRDNGMTWTNPKGIVSATQVVCDGLYNGQNNAVRLRAVNAAGVGAPSPVLFIASYSTPDKPSIFPTAGDGQTSVSFSPIRWDGGRPITNIEYSLDNGPWVARAPLTPSSPVLITGLVNGRRYQVRLRAVNSIGAGIPSDPQSVTPFSPTAPGTISVSKPTPGNGQVTVPFALPTSNPGGPITNVEYSLDRGATWVARTPAGVTSPIVINGLINGTQYFIQMRAVNASGPGRVEGGSWPVTPQVGAIAPGPTRLITVTPGNRQVTVAFSVTPIPAVPFTKIEYSLDSGATWVSRTPPSMISSPLVITGLTNGVKYFIKIRAVNDYGAGEESAAQAVTPKMERRIP